MYRKLIAALHRAATNADEFSKLAAEEAAISKAHLAVRRVHGRVVFYHRRSQ